MLEEQLRSDLMYIINLYGEKGLTVGTEYYIFKDVFNELAKVYNDYLTKEQQKQQQALQKAEEPVEESTKEIKEEEE